MENSDLKINKIMKFTNKKNKDIEFSPTKKTKGYVKIFRKLVKKKNDVLKKILDNKFDKWKKEAFKGTFIRKKIIVRISVSRDHILKNRFGSNLLNGKNDYKKSRAKSADKNLKYINKRNDKEKNVNNIKWTKEKEIKIPQIKKENSKDNPPIKILYKNEKESIFNKPKQNNKINNTQTQTNTGIRQKYQKNNNQTNKYKNIIQNHINDNKKPLPVVYTFEPNQDKVKTKNDNTKDNQQKNIYNSFTTPGTKKNQVYNSYTNVISPKKPLTTNLSSNKQNQTPYDTKKYINLKKNFSETKFYDKNKEKSNTYTRKNIYNGKFAPDEDSKKYMTFTDKRYKHNNAELSNEKLKKGITTVIQHYLGVRERLDNYFNLMPN